MTNKRGFLRFAGSFGVALCVVTAMLWFSLEISGFNERQQRRALELDVAVPAGVYEQQAIAEIQTKRYEPEYVDGRPVARRRLEIIDFQAQATTN